MRADRADVARGVQREPGPLVDVLADVALPHDGAHAMREDRHLAPLLRLRLERARVLVNLRKPRLRRRERGRKQLARPDLLAALADFRGERVDDSRVEARKPGRVPALEPFAVREQLGAARTAR